MKILIQYSMPSNTRIAVSDWLEKVSIVEANSVDDGIAKFNKRDGTWMILDAWQATKDDINYFNKG